MAKHGVGGSPGYEETRIVEGTAIVETDPTVEAEIASRAVIDSAIGSRPGDEIAPTGIISESVVTDAKKAAKPKKSREQLEAEVNSARDDLGTTLDELVSKVYDLTPKNQANKLKKTARHMVAQTVADVKGFFAGEGMPTDPERRKMVERVLKAAGGAAGVVALRAVLRGMRKHHEKATIKKTAKRAAKKAAKLAAESGHGHGGHGHSGHGHSGGSHGHGGHGHVGHGHGGHSGGENTTIIETGPIIEIDSGVIEEFATRKHRARKAK